MEHKPHKCSCKTHASVIQDALVDKVLDLETQIVEQEEQIVDLQNHILQLSKENQDMLNAMNSETLITENPEEEDIVEVSLKEYERLINCQSFVNALSVLDITDNSQALANFVITKARELISPAFKELIGKED